MILYRCFLPGIRIAAVGLLTWACQPGRPEALDEPATVTTYSDHPFEQEYHEAYPVANETTANEVRSIAVDNQATVWVATPAGVFSKKANRSAWTLVAGTDTGPAYSIAVDGRSDIWMGTWDGLYRYEAAKLVRIQGPQAPIAVVCPAPEGTYALGPHGVWLINGQGCQKKTYRLDQSGSALRRTGGTRTGLPDHSGPAGLARSIRNAISDGDGGLWVATDVGLYHLTDAKTRLFQKTDELLSASVKGIAFDTQRGVWAGGLGGVTILNGDKKSKVLQPGQGIPSRFVHCIERAPDGSIWVGTEVGVVRYRPDGRHSLRFTRRWLLDDRVNDIAFDDGGTAWIGTARGVSAIRKRQMTLVQKQDYFYDVLMKRHIRPPWIAGQCRLKTPGDISTWAPDDDDNDGEYTGNYLAMECFRYAATRNPDAKEKARKAFNFLKLLQEVTGTDGFFARTIVPTTWNEVDDKNRHYTAQEQAGELVNEPRFKPVAVRWRLSKDGQWRWKGDTSSDELCGHMMGYYFYYELVADETEKAVVRAHVARLTNHLIAHNFTLTDVDGKHTRWGVWSPDLLNRDPDWAPDRNQNSMELLAFLKLAYHVTGQPKYEQHYRHLIDQEGYLDNMGNIARQNPAWFIYFDVMLAAYVYPILLRCERDPKLLAFYEQHMDSWLEQRKDDHNPLINFLYCYSRNKRVELVSSIEFLKDTPLDLVNWTVDHTKREDINVVRTPVLEERQVNQLPPASIRAVVRWDSNPWAAVSGTPDIEREPVFWLLPYWMGRYLKMIQ